MNKKNAAKEVPKKIQQIYQKYTQHIRKIHQKYPRSTKIYRDIPRYTKYKAAAGPARPDVKKIFEKLHASHQNWKKEMFKYNRLKLNELNYL